LPDENVPLRGILKHSCGTNMTAGLSKGKLKYYLYYRCQKCSDVNIPGKQLHDKLNQILEYLSFTCNQVAYLLAEVRNKIKETIGSRKVQLNGKKEDLSSLTKKIEDLEERAINKEIESETYKKW
jgi:site-specific DNA recombinase